AYDGINISINVSAIQLLRKDFTSNLFGQMESMKINPQTITLEITESVFASNYEDINRILGLLKAAGIRIAIDDFGTGYSSFARSRELNVDCLKIDKHFIDKLTVIQPELATTSDIISMTHKLGYVAIAEGVEHEMQKQHLHRFGCDQIQGYLISPPLNEVAAIDLLKRSTCC
ncbi:MAG TPA: EAL domain-containing protein, partial [Bacillota bacterium]|nr:EAL domain-containing protein [Bacillota bacterium]